MSEPILFITSNGTGLGHLTRSMAIARRLDPGFEPLILTLSGAAPVVADAGFPVEYVPSYGTPGAGSDWRWSRRLRGRLRAAIAEAAPSVLVFDGVHPYQALIDAIKGVPGLRTVWCRRALWRPGSNVGALARSFFFGRVLEPGEFAREQDAGRTVRHRADAHVVAPIVFLDPEELLPRETAERELGLEEGRVNVLVQLGQGSEVRGAVNRSLGRLAAREDVQVAALSSAIAGLGEVPEGVVHLRSTYPISRYYAAFDAAVSAAGYNAYHELLHLGVPSLFVPMPRRTDDQAARARAAEHAGVGWAVAGPDDPGLEAALDDLLDPGGREAMRARLSEVGLRNGAAEAARWLERLARPELRPRRRQPRWRRYLRDPVGSARRAAPFVARMPLHAAALVEQTIVRRPPRTVVLAFGVGAGEMEGALRAGLAATPDPPERVLVVTDSLELAPLRRAGVGVEHVPARGSRQAELAITSRAAGGREHASGYERFVGRRLALILAERPRPRRAVAVGEVSGGLLEATGARSLSRV